MFLREWREKHELSLEELGGRIVPPVAKSTVQRWEKAGPGRLTLGVIAAYAEALGRPTTDMYRLPPAGDEPPSLDAMVADLDDADRGRAFGYVEGLRDRKAS